MKTTFGGCNNSWRMPDEPLPQFKHLSEIHVLADGGQGGWVVEVIGLDEDLNEVKWRGYRLFLQGVEEIVSHYRRNYSSF